MNNNEASPNSASSRVELIQDLCALQSQEISNFFRKLDQNGDGTIDNKEFDDFVGNYGLSLTGSEYHDFIERKNECDTNGDGKIDLSEFKNIVMRLKHLALFINRVAEALEKHYTLRHDAKFFTLLNADKVVTMVTGQQITDQEWHAIAPYFNRHRLIGRRILETWIRNRHNYSMKPEFDPLNAREVKALERRVRKGQDKAKTLNAKMYANRVLDRYAKDKNARPFQQDQLKNLERAACLCSGTEKDFRAVFNALDTDNRGFLQAQAVHDYVNNMRMSFSIDEMQAIEEIDIDKDRSGTIEFDEFFEYMMRISNWASFAFQAKKELLEYSKEGPGGLEVPIAKIREIVKKLIGSELTPDEFSDLKEPLPPKCTTIPLIEIDHWIRDTKCDALKSGTVFDAATFRKQQLMKLSQTDVRMIFDEIDSNKNGDIEPQEFANFLKSYHLRMTYHEGLGFYRLKSRLGNDSDNKSNITLEQFTQLVSKLKEWMIYASNVRDKVEEFLQKNNTELTQEIVPHLIKDLTGQTIDDKYVQILFDEQPTKEPTAKIDQQQFEMWVRDYYGAYFQSDATKASDSDCPT